MLRQSFAINVGPDKPILPQNIANMVGHILPLSDWASAGTYQAAPGVDDHPVHLVTGLTGLTTNQLAYIPLTGWLHLCQEIFWITTSHLMLWAMGFR
jgi:hypothetical protein